LSLLILSSPLFSFEIELTGEKPNYQENRVREVQKLIEVSYKVPEDRLEFVDVGSGGFFAERTEMVTKYKTVDTGETTEIKYAYKMNLSTIEGHELPRDLVVKVNVSEPKNNLAKPIVGIRTENAKEDYFIGHKIYSGTSYATAEIKLVPKSLYDEFDDLIFDDIQFDSELKVISMGTNLAALLEHRLINLNMTVEMKRHYRIIVKNSKGAGSSQIKKEVLDGVYRLHFKVPANDIWEVVANKKERKRNPVKLSVTFLPGLKIQNGAEFFNFNLRQKDFLFRYTGEVEEEKAK